MPEEDKTIQIQEKYLRVISFLLEKEIKDYSPVSYNRGVARYLKILKNIKIIIDWYI